MNNFKPSVEDLKKLSGRKISELRGYDLAVFNFLVTHNGINGIEARVEDGVITAGDSVESIDEDSECVDVYRRETPPIATDSFTGIVSFRSECPDDYRVLVEILDKNYPLSYALGSNFPAHNDEGVELIISEPLTIKVLRDLMNCGEDLHVMSETLRALPLSANSLERLDTLDVYDWTGLTEGQLLGYPD